MRWLMIFFVLLILFGGLRRWLGWLGLGKVPGDFSIRIFGREFFVPLGSSVVLSIGVMLLVHWY